MLILFNVLMIVSLTLGLETSKCYEGVTRTHFVAHCANLGLEKCPKNLNTRITLLDLSNNYISSLKSDSLASYSKLVELYLRGNSIYTIADDAFNSLTNLKILSLEHNALMKLPALPKSLTTLELSNNPILFSTIDDVKFENFEALEKLYLRKVGLVNFPTFLPAGYNLIKLDIRENPKVTKFEVAHLVPLCKLKTLLVGEESNFPFEMDGDGCACAAVLTWMREFGIEGTIITCKNQTNAKCDGINLEEFKSQRTKCVFVSKLNSLPHLYFIIGGIAVPVALFLCCYYFNRRYKANTDLIDSS